MATAATAEITTLERLGHWIDTDPILTGFRERALKVGLGFFIPSGVDLAVAAVARGVCLDGRPNQVAIALPRGGTRLPLFLGIYFAVGRAGGKLPLKGSIAISSRDPDLRR